ncbi:SDR family NAD(P)-dependent oxidoreductase [Salinarimonas chemoclinalis]|uniref:SDR family NAD(P)-dependent oxidoreductase n=1 Tax=Salinarimonas chemoclinalis TaxID=3241599 RepID=UPI003557971E
MSARVLIWGGSGGVGAATARALAEAGWRVHLAARDESRLADAARAIDAAGYTVADALDPESVARATEEASAGEGLGGLVYAVGSINLKPLAKLTDEDFLADYRLNALGAARAIQAALKPFRQANGASVVLFSTVAANQGFSAHASVAMAKGAVQGLTLALAAELAPKVRVNCIAPSLLDTDLARPLTSNATMAQAIAGMHPIPRLGTGEDVGSLAAFLVSPQASWITGQTIGVDGGRSTLRVKS